MPHEFLDYASKMYYDGTPVLSDEEFDRLAAQQNYNKVGTSSTKEGTLSHYQPMYSLQKCFDIDNPPFPVAKNVLSTPKLDGAAVSLLYVDGTFEVGLTRGDGKVGQMITEKLRSLVPNKIALSGVVQITGEVVAPKSIENSRNYAAGALNLKSVSEFLERDLTFFAYDIYPNIETTYMEAMLSLYDMNFKTVFTDDVVDFPQDGVVYRMNNYNEFINAGYTAHHPRGAFALKETKEGVVTVLRDVVWQVGKSGIVSPVAILDPVNIDGATVSRATLHNMKYITELDLEIGCSVEVIRSGDIIPRIVKRV